MSIKKKLMKQGMKMMADPRVMKLMQDERFVKAMMAAMSVPGRMSTFAHEQSGRLARVMALATEQEVKDLRRTVRALEEQLAELKKQSGGKHDGARPGKPGS
jgi:cell division FtsZ-interacting protein ZapD